MNAYFYTLGCKVNQYETQAMMKLLEEQGYTVAEYRPGQPDAGDCVIVINSCTVTGESDRKLRQLLRRCRREQPHAVMVLTGCMPQAFPDAAASFAEADIVLGNAARATLPSQINRFRTLGARIVEIPAHGLSFENMTIDEFQGRTRAFVKIEDGCNRFCSYCIIPYARGRVRSRPLPDLRAEAERLAARGYSEIVLVGINLTAYGQDTGTTICDAVSCVAAVDGIRRVRLGSIEPDHMTPAVVEQLAAIPKLCPQFHLALQSGCDATLKRMNRHYTTGQFREVCCLFRERFPGCALTTDVMVGFPGETPEEFEQSVAFVRDIGFSRLHCFPYSRRPGTPAARAAGQVSQTEKLRRNRLMIAAGEESRDAYAASLVGTVVEVLTESRREDGLTEGYTDTYVPVLLPETEPNIPVIVRIEGQEHGICQGSVIK